MSAGTTSGRTAPGPRVGPLGLLRLGRAPEAQLEMLREASREYGGVVRIKVLNRFLHLIDDPKHIRYVLQHNHRNYRKSRNYDPLKLVVGEGLLTSEGELWREQRRLVQPAFHRRRIAGFASLMAAEAESVAARWSGPAARGEVLDVAREMAALTLVVVGKSLLGADLGERTERIFESQSFLNRYVDSRMGGFFHLPPGAPTPKNRRFRKALGALDEEIYGIIRLRRQGDDPGNDLLSMLLETQDKEGMTDQQLRDEVATILLAGHETTANALSWAWYLLAKHPEVEGRLHDELEEVLGGRTPGFEDLPHLSYAGMVFQETLRLYPPAWAISRAPVKDDELGGYRVPAGSTVLVSPYVTHRNPRFWKVPQAFDPDRFDPKHPEDRPEFAYLPFGAGPRRCIGNNFATMEGTLVLATIAQRHRLLLASDRRVRPEPLVTLRPRAGIPMKIHKRERRT